MMPDSAVQGSSNRSVWRKGRAGLRFGVGLILVVLAAAACSTSEPVASEDDSRPQIVASISVWADVVDNITCGSADVVTLIPPGRDTHYFEPSLADRAKLSDASLVVMNGLGLESQFEDMLEAVEAEGVAFARVEDYVEAIEGGHSHDEHGDEHDDEHSDEHDDEHGDEHDDEHSDEHDDEHDDEHGDEHDDEHGDEHDEEHGDEDSDEHDDEDSDEHDDEHDDEHSDDNDHGDEKHDEHGHDHQFDPHVWFDPTRVAAAVEGLADVIVSQSLLPDVDVAKCSSDYIDDLLAVDAEIIELVAELNPTDRRIVSNHETLGYFAERYEFEVLGTVIPSSSTLADTSPRMVADLVEQVKAEDLAAIFSDYGAPNDDVLNVADKAGVPVVELHTDSLGPVGSGSETYVDFIRANGVAIVTALGSSS